MRLRRGLLSDCTAIMHVRSFARRARAMSTASGALRRVQASFDHQGFMQHIGASIVHLGPGECHIGMPCTSVLEQQRGYIHAGATISIADSAGGYAAMTLFAENEEVLTTELKVNLLRPATGARLLAEATVIKPGRTLSVVSSNVFGVDDEGTKTHHIALMTATMMKVEMPG